jgi:hypothetical protein
MRLAEAIRGGRMGMLGAYRCPFRGSKAEKLNASICFPLWPQERTSLNRVGMSVRCHERKSFFVRAPTMPVSQNENCATSGTVLLSHVLRVPDLKGATRPNSAAVAPLSSAGTTIAFHGAPHSSNFAHSATATVPAETPGTLMVETPVPAHPLLLKLLEPLMMIVSAMSCVQPLAVFAPPV